MSRRVPLLNKYSFIEIEKKTVPEGSLSFIEGNRHIPFDIARIYYLYDVPTSATRGAHAHKRLDQVLIALSGSFDIELDDGIEQQTLHLHQPHEGLLIKPGLWRNLTNFSTGSVCLVLASLKYDENDYIRDYAEFLEFAEINNS